MNTYPAMGPQSAWKKIRSCLRHIVGASLELIHAPATIREFEYVDPLTNETVSRQVHDTPCFTSGIDGFSLNEQRAGLMEPVRHLRSVLPTGWNSAIKASSRAVLAAALSIRSTKKWVIPAVGGLFRWY